MFVQAFPCSQFLGQEPISDADMPAFLASKGISFPVFGKIEVNGDGTDPLFSWLKVRCVQDVVLAGLVSTFIDHQVSSLFMHVYVLSPLLYLTMSLHSQEKAPGFLLNAVKWNFTKFLVVNGLPVKRYGPKDPLGEIEADVIAALEGAEKSAPMTAAAAAAPKPVGEL